MDTGNYFGFPRTTWRTIVDLKKDNNVRYKEQLGYLMTLYWKPVYRYIRYVGYKNETDASDLTQEYFATLLERDFLKQVSPDKGRFRVFIRISLKNFLVDQWKKTTAKKRGGDKASFSLDTPEAVCGPSVMTPDEYFDGEWAREVIARSVGILKERLRSQGKDAYTKVFEQYYLEAGSTKEVSYKSIAEKLDMKPKDVENHLAYTRKLLRRIIQEEISAYVIDSSEVEDEMKHLFSAAKKTGISI